MCCAVLFALSLLERPCHSDKVQGIHVEEYW